MSRPTPTFYLPMSFDNPYPGPLRLGQLISNIKDPRNPIDPSGPQSFLKYNIEVYENNQAVVVHKDEKTKDVSMGLFFTALQAVAVRAGFKIDNQAFRSILSNIESLDYKGIMPTGDYVRKSMESTAVQKWLKDHWFRNMFKDVYMITGLKIARPMDAQRTVVALEDDTASDTSGAVEASGNAGGTPLGGGVHSSRSTSTHRAYSFVPTQPFVYGFELRSCHYGADGASSKPKIEGALLNTETNEHLDIQPAEDSNENFQFVFYNVADEDLTVAELGKEAKDFQSQLKVDEADETECYCVNIRL